MKYKVTLDIRDSATFEVNAYDEDGAVDEAYHAYLMTLWEQLDRHGRYEFDDADAEEVTEIGDDEEDYYDEY